MTINCDMVIKRRVLRIITNLIIVKSNLQEEGRNIYIPVVINLLYTERNPNPKAVFFSPAPW